MKDTGKPIGFYIERGWCGFNPASAWVYFRRIPMVVAKYNIIGCGFWAATFYYREPWNDFNTELNYSKAAVYYPGNNGPINTINFYAWREGLDELLTIKTLSGTENVDCKELAEKYLTAQSPVKQDRLRAYFWKMLK